ncbi:hypothetical protein BAE44_0015659, partial [Dichanthelium oligosanthes]
LRVRFPLPAPCCIKGLFYLLPCYVLGFVLKDYYCICLSRYGRDLYPTFSPTCFRLYRVKYSSLIAHEARNLDVKVLVPVSALSSPYN